jgi:hypothetical protein
MGKKTFLASFNARQIYVPKEIAEPLLIPDGQTVKVTIEYPPDGDDE